jgi:penicillin-binding protein 1A
MKFLAILIRPLSRIIIKKQILSLLGELRILQEIHNQHYGGQLPPLLIKALIEAEDHRYYRHGGVDPIALMRAAWQFIRHSRIQGASTIEQQLVRTVTKRYERTIRRKLREIMLATCLPAQLSKQEIAGIYLMVAYYGWQMEGLPRACTTTGIQLKPITASECAVLVARLRYPRSALSLTNRENLFQQRVERIMRMINPQVQQLLSRGMPIDELDASPL